MQEIIIPNEFQVGYNARVDTFSGKLGYMIYRNKSDGTFGQQKSFDTWINKTMGIDTIKNEYLPGFVLNKGRLNHYRFGASAKFRVFHPHGFEFEISLENLSLLLAYTTVSSGEINIPCCIGWYRKACFLVPKVDLSTEVKLTNVDVVSLYNKAKSKKASNKPIPYRSLTTNRIVENDKKERFFVFSNSSSTQTEITPFVVKNNGEVGLLDIDMYPYSSINEKHEKFFYPLTNVNQKVSIEDIKKFTSIVTKEDLTEVEKENLRHYGCGYVFEQDVKLKAYDVTKENIKDLILLNKNNKKISFYNLNKTLNALVKINDIVYLLGYGSQFERLIRYELSDKYGYLLKFQNDVQSVFNMSQKGTGYVFCIYLTAILNLKNPNKRVSKVERCKVINLYIDQFGNLIDEEKVLDEVAEGVAAQLTQLTEEEVNKVNDTVIRSLYM